MKVKYLKAFLVASMLAPSAALAKDGGNCAIFNDTDMRGDTKTLMANRDDLISSVALQDAAFPKKIQSVWIQHGYALETYSASRFGGTLTTFAGTSSDARYHAEADGHYANLSDFNLSQPVASYRCRALGTPMAKPGVAPYLTMRAYNNTSFQWISGGTHYNQKFIEIRDLNGQRTLRAFADNTYGINFNLLTLNLDTGEIKITYRRTPDIRGVEILQKPENYKNMAGTLAYYGALKYMHETLSTVAGGSLVGYAVQPPKPELVEWGNLLDLLVNSTFN